MTYTIIGIAVYILIRNLILRPLEIKRIQNEEMRKRLGNSV